MTFLIISFVAGVLTVLTPCILPLLPIVIGGSAADHKNRWKPFVITASLALSVILFTFLLKASTLLIDVPQTFWTYVSGGILVVLGLFMLFPALWERLPFQNIVSRKSQGALAAGNKAQSFTGDIIMGAALGPVFSTCSPTYFIILATVLPASFALGTIYLLAFVFGLALMLLLIGVVGQRLVGRLNASADPRGWVKRGMGVLIIFVGLLILTGNDKKFETYLLDSGFIDFTAIEQRILESTNDNETKSGAAADRSERSEKSPTTRAPELVGIDDYINTNGAPITINEYKGNKVVLVDFWTYSCINCRRTTPYLNSWHEKYADEGLVIIGVHTPEFAFEKNVDNVRDAVQELGIAYPVVLDNEYATWRAFGNRYWPRKYLIDKEGNIVYDHIGEGAYDATEREIRKLLGIDSGSSVDWGGNLPETVSVDFSEVDSPETYFGAARNKYLGNGMRNKEGEQNFMAPTSLVPNTLYLDGVWRVEEEYAVPIEAGVGVVYRFRAKNVYMVAEGTGSTVEVLLDGEPVGHFGGADVHDGRLFVDEERLYHLIELNDYGMHTFELRVGKGVKFYTLTFG